MSKFFFFLITFFFISCTSTSLDEQLKNNKKIFDASKNETILTDQKVIEDSSFILEKYPIQGEIIITEGDIDTITPRPKQLFSAASSNEIRVHKLGEIRWIYLGQEPSAAWPMTIEYLEQSKSLGLDSFDANEGIINSKIFKLNNLDSKYVFKIERGLQQSSSEIFVSQLKRVNNAWVIVSSKENNLDYLVNEFSDYLSKSGPLTGTSLVALNLNTSNKTEVVTDDFGMSKIKLRINFPRAWAALRRSLVLAGYKIIDEDRNEGKFYLEYSLKRSLLDRRPDITRIEINVNELSPKECIISTGLDEENKDLSEEIISQINQSLS